MGLTSGLGFAKWASLAVVGVILTIFVRDAFATSLGKAAGETGSGFSQIGSSIGSFGTGLGQIGGGISGLLGGVATGFTSLLTTPISGIIGLAAQGKALFEPSNSNSKTSAPSGGTGGINLAQSTSESTPKSYTVNLVG